MLSSNVMALLLTKFTDEEGKELLQELNVIQELNVTQELRATLGAESAAFVPDLRRCSLSGSAAGSRWVARKRK